VSHAVASALAYYLEFSTTGHSSAVHFYLLGETSAFLKAAPNGHQKPQGHGQLVKLPYFHPVVDN
jgi:hypothetical protein